MADFVQFMKNTFIKLLFRLCRPDIIDRKIGMEALKEKFLRVMNMFVEIFRKKPAAPKMKTENFSSF